jgi:hypothetical protein
VVFEIWFSHSLVVWISCFSFGKVWNLNLNLNLRIVTCSYVIYPAFRTDGFYDLPQFLQPSSARSRFCVGVCALRMFRRAVCLWLSLAGQNLFWSWRFVQWVATFLSLGDECRRRKKTDITSVKYLCWYLGACGCSLLFFFFFKVPAARCKQVDVLRCFISIFLFAY